MVDVPKVSVLVPTFNRAQEVAHAIDSALMQTYRQLEIIVVDDESTDETADTLSRYGSQIRYFRIPRCGLPSKARNAGLEVTRGDYIAFLDSDDEWLPQKLERQIPILDRYPNVGLVCSNALVLKNDQYRPTKLYLQENQGKSGWSLKELLEDNFVITSTAVTRRSILDRVGMFPEDPLLRGVEDYDLWLRIAAVSEVYYIPQALAIYYDHAGSIHRQQSRVNYWQGMLLVLEHLRQHLRNCGYQNALIEKLIDDLVYTYSDQLINAYWVAGRPLTAANHLLQLMRRRPIHGLRFGYRITWKGLRFMIAKGANRKICSNTKHLQSRGLVQQGQEQDKASETSNADNQAVKLHLGCGEIYLPGYINVDLPPSHHTIQKCLKADIYADIRQLSCPAESVEEIRLHHVFEHFDRVTALHLLIEWYRWLKEGGRLIIETPDFEKSINVFSDRIEHQLKILRHIFGSHETSWAFHVDGWYRAKFELYLESLGYRDLSFQYSEWKGTHNITVTTKKLCPFKTQEELKRAAEKLLHFSMIDDSESERRLLTVWADQLERSTRRQDR